MRLDISKENIKITEKGYYEVYGISYSNNIYVNCEATLLIDNITIDLDNVSKAAIIVDKLSKLTLIIRGSNYIRSDVNYAGIQMIEKSLLTITGENNSSTLYIISGTSGAGIGGGYGANYDGSLNIESGTINIVSAREGAGIGGGNGCNGGGVFSGNLDIQGGIMKIITGNSGGAAIGGGSNSDLAGRVTISGGDTTILSNNYSFGAGIGGGYDGDLSGYVLVNSGNISINGGSGCAAIGGGIGVVKGGNLSGTVIILGGTIIAKGGEYPNGEGGAGIGGGLNGSLSGNIGIISGNITAIGVGGAGDIGRGSNGDVTGDVHITVKSLEINPTYMKLNVSEKALITSKVVFEADINADISQFKKVLYYSEDEGIALVNDVGIVTGVGNGNTNIIVTSEVDKSKIEVCGVVVGGSKIILGEVDTVMYINKKIVNENDLESILCNVNKPIRYTPCIEEVILKKFTKTYIPQCEQYINAEFEYKKYTIGLYIWFSLALCSCENSLNRLIIYDFQDCSMYSIIEFCADKNKNIDIDKYEINVTPTFEIDKDSFKDYYVFKIKAIVELMIKM